MKRCVYILALSGMLVASASLCGDGPPSSESAKPVTIRDFDASQDWAELLPTALELLPKADRVTFGPVGFAGMESDWQICAEIILAESSDPERDFMMVFDKGSLPAKVYALHYLYQLKSPRYAELRAKVDDNAEVVTMSGCIVHKTTVANLLPESKPE